VPTPRRYAAGSCALRRADVPRERAEPGGPDPMPPPVVPRPWRRGVVGKTRSLFLGSRYHFLVGLRPPPHGPVDGISHVTKERQSHCRPSSPGVSSNKIAPGDWRVPVSAHRDPPPRTAPPRPARGPTRWRAGRSWRRSGPPPAPGPRRSAAAHGPIGQSPARHSPFLGINALRAPRWGCVHLGGGDSIHLQTHARESGPDLYARRRPPPRNPLADRLPIGPRRRLNAEEEARVVRRLYRDALARAPPPPASRPASR